MTTSEWVEHDCEKCNTHYRWRHVDGGDLDWEELASHYCEKCTWVVYYECGTVSLFKETEEGEES